MLYVIVDILLTLGKHLHDRIMSLRREFWVQKNPNNLTPPLYYKSAFAKLGKWCVMYTCMFVRDVDFSSVSTMLW